MSESLTSLATHLDRRLKNILRDVDAEMLAPPERAVLHKLKLAMNEVRLDVRDYEYAQSREEQLKWAKIGRHNVTALNKLLLSLEDVFSPADIAECGAYLETLRSALE